jgi:exonuclease SbcC
MREIARQRAADLKVELAAISAKVEQLEALADQLQGRKEQLESLRQRVEVLAKAEPGIADLEHRIEAASEARAGATKRLDVLDGLRDRLPGETVAEALLGEVTAARARRVEAADALEEAADRTAVAEEEVRESEAAGTGETIEVANAILAAIDPLRNSMAEAEARVERFAERVAQHHADVTEAEKRLAAASAAAEAASTAHAAAAAEADTAEEELHAARHQDMAASLRTELQAGEPCPVCRQKVAEPPAVVAVDLEDAERRLQKTRQARDRAEAASARALAENTTAAEALDLSRGSAEGAATELAAAAEEVGSLSTAMQAQTTRLSETLGAGDPRVLLDGLRSAQQTRADAVTATRKAVDRARAAHDAAIRAEQAADKQLAALRVDVIELAGRIDEELEHPQEDPASVAAALIELRERWLQLESELQQTRAAATTDAEKAQSELSGVLESLEIEGPLALAIAAADARVELLSTEVADAEGALADSSATITARDELVAARERYERITSDLTNSRFIRYLLDDERSRLAELGSEHFERLSSGRYRFTEDGAFSIVDLTAADAVRKADSLSGGETFLASLSLALALAEMVTRTGGRLDSFFLDEGFGALDLEHLDLAMEGVEALAADGTDRLVVVVSHVPELRHRLEDLIELDRNPTTGDTRVVHA